MQKLMICFVMTHLIHISSLRGNSLLLTFIISITFSLMSCNEEQVLTHSLSKKLQDFMTSYDYPVYGLYFIEHDDVIFITIEGSYTYDKYLVDGYFFLDEKLVTYCFLDNRRQDSIINVEKSIPYRDTIPGYESDDPFAKNRFIYEASEEVVYALTPNMQLADTSAVVSLIRQGRHVSDNNVIRNKQMNTVLNNTIQNSIQNLFIIRIKEINKNLFFSITPSVTYDSRHALGYFYRDNYPVVIYSDKSHGDFSSLIEMDSLKCVKDGIKNLRDYYNGIVFISKKVYMISGDKIVDVSENQLIKMSLDVMED